MEPPPPPGRKQLYYCIDGEEVAGPILADELFLKVARGEVPGEVVVCAPGSDEWISFTELPDTTFSPACRAKLPKILKENADKYMEKELGPAVQGCALLLLGLAIVFSIRSCAG